jgi:dihydrofolate synthase/folylpolyglutamate synthase
VGGWEAYLESLAAFGMRPGLERVRALLDAFGGPERSFRAVHVVGTNGKSSTTRYLEAVLRAHRLRSGAYLSPHLTGYHERVIINGSPIGGEALGSAVERVRVEIARLPADLREVTQFEVLTTAAFLAMAEANVEVAAVEAGLGGRLDATNVLAAPVVVLTNIALEHTDILGSTREAIFAEKAAVIAGGDAVFGPLDGLEPLAEARSRAVGACPHLWGRDVTVEGGSGGLEVKLRDSAGEHTYGGLRLSSPAQYQVINVALAVAGAHLLRGGLEESVVRGAVGDLAVPGRLQVFEGTPLLIADGAHNPHGATALAASLRMMARPAPRVGLIAIMRDKAVEDMLSVVAPLLDVMVCTQASERRSQTAAALAESARKTGGARLRVECVADARAGFERALAVAGTQGSVLITGSLYLLQDLADVLTAGGRP